MTDLGFVLYTGHGGRKCHYAIGPRKVIVAHGNGIMPMSVSFCRCGRANAGAESGEATTSGGEAGPDDHEALQLIDLGLYPGSWERPQTAFTQDVLRTYILLSFQANMSAQDFYTFLKRRTDNVSPESVPVRSFDVQCEVEILNASPGSVSGAHDVQTRVRLPADVQTQRRRAGARTSSTYAGRAMSCLSSAGKEHASGVEDTIPRPPVRRGRTSTESY